MNFALAFARSIIPPFGLSRILTLLPTLTSTPPAKPAVLTTGCAASAAAGADVGLAATGGGAAASTPPFPAGALNVNGTSVHTFGNAVIWSALAVTEVLITQPIFASGVIPRTHPPPGACPSN